MSKEDLVDRIKGLLDQLYLGDITMVSWYCLMVAIIEENMATIAKANNDVRWALKCAQDFAE